MRKKGKFDNLLGAAVEQKQNQEAQIKGNIQIEAQFKDFIPPLSEEEFNQLESNILAEGCRDALIVWQKASKYILIDGHNRYQICQKHGLDFKLEIREFENEEAAKDWMINNQIGKRNITEEVKSYLRGQQYAKAKQQQGGKRTKKASGQSDHLKTHEQLAEQFKVSPKTIQRDEKYAIGIDLLTANDQQLKWDILNRKITLPKSLVSNMGEKSSQEIKQLRGELSKEGKIKSKRSQAQLSKQEAEIQNIRKSINQALKLFAKEPQQTYLEEIKRLVADLEKLI